jgi:Ca2+-binding RTX toxin-like protein
MDLLSYTFAPGGDAGGLVDIDVATGVITVANEALLAATTASSVGIIVRVANGLSFVDQPLTIHVNHAPALATLSNDTVRTAENGASVAQVIGLDFDGDTLHYAFVNNDGGTSALSADGTYAISANGVITVNDPTLLDGRPKPIIVRTMDPRGRFVDDSFIINDDTNHAPTGARLPDFTVPDNAPNGTRVGDVVGEDPDNDVLHYGFVGNDGNTSALSADGAFAISANGLITVNDATLLNEAAKDIIVRIMDPHGLSFDQPLTIIVTGHSDTPSLQAPASQLSGGSGEGVVNGTAGNDTLSGGGGSDTYVFGSGFGQTTIHNLAQDGLTVTRGEIDFGTGVSNQNLWFEQKGNDLQIDLMGTQGHITIAGWYGSDPSARVQSIQVADGSKLDSQMNQLVSAMAAYSAIHPGFDPTAPQTLMPTDSQLQTAIGAAWHH